MEIMPQFTLSSPYPNTAQILSIIFILFTVSAPLIFSLLPHTSVRSLLRAYREGGVVSLKGMSLHVWIVALGAQIISWVSLVIVLFVLLSGIFQFDPMAIGDLEKQANGLRAFQNGILWAMLFPLALLFVPGCLRLAPLIFLFRQRAAVLQ